MGVHDQGPNDAGCSKAELKVDGIDIDVRPAVFVGLYHTHKTNGEGDIDRHKTRCAVKGHKGNMQKGNHFNETFAATPREDTARILTALMVLLNLVYKTGDVVKAYCSATSPIMKWEAARKGSTRNTRKEPFNSVSPQCQKQPRSRLYKLE